jgi:hypothetical protein
VAQKRECHESAACGEKGKGVVGADQGESAEFNPALSHVDKLSGYSGKKEGAAESPEKVKSD